MRPKGRVLDIDRRKHLLSLFAPTRKQRVVHVTTTKLEVGGRGVGKSSAWAMANASSLIPWTPQDFYGMYHSFSTQTEDFFPRLSSGLLSAKIFPSWLGSRIGEENER